MNALEFVTAILDTCGVDSPEFSEFDSDALELVEVRMAIQPNYPMVELPSTRGFVHSDELEKSDPDVLWIALHQPSSWGREAEISPYAPREVFEAH